MSFINIEKGEGWLSEGVGPEGAGAMVAILGFQMDVQRAYHPEAFQVQVVKTQTFAFQTKVVLYNTDNLRILCDYPSRGLATPSGGNNSWGNPDGTGQNWKATSTEPSGTNDFDVANVNTDITEQYWRSATGVLVSINLDCDTEGSGIFSDTLALLNTNLTTSALINYQASNDSNFASIEFSTFITPEIDGDNVWVSPELPINSYRYWRVAINDPTNTDNFVRVGTIIFGSSVIFSGECFVDRVEFEKVNFTDSIVTEGQTTIQNDRGVKKKVRLGFRNLDYNLSNFSAIQEIFSYARTVLKCLWIPTPDYPKRFMVFGKLARIPKEVHNVKAQDINYVDFNVEVDESK